MNKKVSALEVAESYSIFKRTDSTTENDLLTWEHECVFCCVKGVQIIIPNIVYLGNIVGYYQENIIDALVAA